MLLHGLYGLNGRAFACSTLPAQETYQLVCCTTETEGTASRIHLCPARFPLQHKHGCSAADQKSTSPRVLSPWVLNSRCYAKGIKTGEQMMLSP